VSPIEVVVTVGTDHHRFDRLVGWIDRWASTHPDCSVLVQHGTADPPAHGRGVAMLGYDELVSAMAQARVVVAQGGPATVMDARSVGRRPIVVPRLARFHEVVDDHQVTFGRWAAARDLVLLAEDEHELGRLLDAALDDDGLTRIPPDRSAAGSTIDEFRRVVAPLLETAQRRRAARRIRRR
jgi:UDP-N-acetylglucosamine transferase subunit ALG13